MIKLNSLKANLSRENDGDWIKIPPELVGDGEGVEFKVRSLIYAKFRIARDQFILKVSRAAGGITKVDAEKLYVGDGNLLADHILLDWRGLSDDAGKPVPYDADLAREILVDPAFRTIQAAVAYAARQLGEITAEVTADELKN
jgi:hypothetical protein